jgi:hypothetical protein
MSGSQALVDSLQETKSPGSSSSNRGLSAVAGFRLRAVVRVLSATKESSLRRLR